uniref:NADH dehydrogenase subunit 6 n=1 Tax=Anthribidae sp. 9 ACP-2013 TaxID=1434436 RepID=A0A3G5FNW3_9CUCU|nr:NADH dehydrogenase subunit 6 [Anthribidae sp. 9 ACP-2013]
MLSLISSLTFLFMFLKHPLSLGFTILIQTILIALTTGLLNLNFWFSYILFLILVGSMMILFIYMTSIASNEKFKFSFFLMIIIIFMMMIITFMYKNPDIQNLFNLSYKMTMNMSKYINSDSLKIFFLMITYLLITLITVVKISNMQNSPLRQLN